MSVGPTARFAHSDLDTGLETWIFFTYREGGALPARGLSRRGGVVEFAGVRPQTVESAQKIRAGRSPCASCTLDSRKPDLRVGIASEAHAWHDMVEAPHVSESAAETVKARAAFAN